MRTIFVLHRARRATALCRRLALIHTRKSLVVAIGPSLAWLAIRNQAIAIIAYRTQARPASDNASPPD